MKPLYTDLEFNSATSNDFLSLQCYNCGKSFLKQKKLIKTEIKYKTGRAKFCNLKCHYETNRPILKKEVECTNCGTLFLRVPSDIKKNNYCSNSCNASYCNMHKTHGIRRSKLEIWLEEQLTILYPNLPINFNKKDAINSELDIYIPSLKLAFELNGIYHYEPIHGQNKLDQIQNNDHRKFQACAEKEISLCIIDTSMFKHFKPAKAEKFLNIITEIINKHVAIPRVELGTSAL